MRKKDGRGSDRIEEEGAEEEEEEKRQMSICGKPEIFDASQAPSI